MYLDYEIKSPEERVEYVAEILKDMENPTTNDLTYMADYLLKTQERNQTKKERRAEYPCITSNRETTIKKREASIDNLFGILGDDAYNLISDIPGSQVLDPKDKSVSAAPVLETYKNLIEDLNRQLERAEGKNRYAIKKQIIETYQQMAAVKESGRPSPNKNPQQVRSVARLDLSNELIDFDDRGMPESNAAITLFNPDHVAYLMAYYSPLKQETWEDLNGDIRWLLIDLENTATRALPPLLMDLVIMKVDGLSNQEVAEKMFDLYGEDHTDQYWSTIWRKRVPKLIAEQAKKDYILWYWRHTGYGHWRKCRRCGCTKPAHPLFFTTNGDNKPYSICRQCRSKKVK